MKPTIIAHSLEQLKKIIKQEIKSHGYKCDLNNIDVSQITDMTELFRESGFNGDISQWDASNVLHMTNMFYGANFNGDISKWNTSKVWDMNSIFYKSNFNRDISKWDVSKVVWMEHAFRKSAFTGDLSNWKPYSVEDFIDTFDDDYKVPYWAEYEDEAERKLAIDSYHNKKQIVNELVKELNINNFPAKRIKL